MNQPFAPAAAELKALRSKLNFLTYQALFGKKLEERQQAGVDAAAIHARIEEVLTGTWAAASQVTDFSRSPKSYGGLFDSLNQFIELVEAPSALQEQSRVSTAMLSGN